MSQTIIETPVEKNNQTELPSVGFLQQHHWTYLQQRYQMTPRELQIAQLACKGLANEQIAQALNVKHGTVKTHLRNLYRKVWVHNKISMFLRFLEVTIDRLDTLNPQSDVVCQK